MLYAVSNTLSWMVLKELAPGATVALDQIKIIWLVVLSRLILSYENKRIHAHS